MATWWLWKLFFIRIARVSVLFWCRSLVQPVLNKWGFSLPILETVTKVAIKAAGNLPFAALTPPLGKTFGNTASLTVHVGMLPCSFDSEAHQGAAFVSRAVAKVQEHQEVPRFYSCKLMLYTVRYYLHTSIDLFVCTDNSISLVYIALAYISSNKKSTKAPPKLKQNLLTI